MFLLTPEEFAVVNDSPETGVRFTHDPEGHYVGTLAATHQIHCVVSNFIFCCKRVCSLLTERPRIRSAKPFGFTWTITG